MELLNKVRLLIKLWRDHDNSASTLASLLFYSKLKRQKTISIKIFGEDIYIRTSTNDLGVALSSLEKEFKSLSLAYTKDYKGLIIDAGGYIGTTAIAFAKMYPGATIISIEPSTENFEILKRNIRNYTNIYAHNAALMPKSFAGCITLLDLGTGYWGFTVIEKPKNGSANFIEKVDVISIEKILEEYGYDKIMIFKMDIEGTEYYFFKQSDWLEKTNVLIVELHEGNVPGCKQAFEDANKLRFVYKDRGEKFISIGKQYFVNGFFKQ